MVETVHIPEGKDHHHNAGDPRWFRVRDQDGKVLRPLIRCNCGAFIGLANHYVHANGVVTASFFDSNQPFMWKGKQVHNPNGCNWHVMLILDGYDCGEFLPEN